VYGHREAVVDEPNRRGGLGRVTYSQFGDMARSLAVALDELGIGEHERVAIVSPTRHASWSPVRGQRVRGRVLVPINFRLNAEEIRYIIEHSGSSVLLVDPELDESLRHIPVSIASCSAPTPTLSSSSEGVAPRLQVTDENATVSINYTSGTTARRRACSSPIATSGSMPSPSLALAMTDRTCTCTRTHLPLQWLGHAVRGHRHGGASGHHPQDRRRGDPASGGGRGRHPVQLRARGDRRRARRAAVRRQTGVAVPGRGRFAWSWRERRRRPRPSSVSETELGWEFIQIYGLTETAPLLRSTGRPRNGTVSTRRSGHAGSPRGRPAVGVRMRVDEEGELLARSNHVFEGYWNQPEETAKAIADGCSTPATGALATGPTLPSPTARRDVIISGGENVSSSEVEDCLFQHPAVAEVAVIGVPDEKWGEDHQGPRRAAPGTVCDERELIEHCRSRMAHYKCPTSIEIRDALVRTATKLRARSSRELRVVTPRRARHHEGDTARPGVFHGFRESGLDSVRRRGDETSGISIDVGPCSGHPDPTVVDELPFCHRPCPAPSTTRA